MNDEQTTRWSKKLSWLLRHGANESGLAMDSAGFASIADVKRVLGIGEEALAAAVANNDKARLQVLGDRIRAVQGHSFDGTPVTLEGLEASWGRYEGAANVWHGTNLQALEVIARAGLLPMERTHVHLAAAMDSVVGKRANVAVLLEVSTAALAEAELPIFVSPNGVLLCRRVPAPAIVGLRACTKAALGREPELRALFRLG